MPAVRQQQRVRTPRVLRQRTMEEFMTGQRTNLSRTIVQSPTPTPLQLGMGLATMRVLAQCELQNTVTDPDDN